MRLNTKTGLPLLILSGAIIRISGETIAGVFSSECAKAFDMCAVSASEPPTQLFGSQAVARSGQVKL